MKKLFQKIFQILPKNTCDDVSSFNTVANWSSATLIKGDSGADALNDENFAKFSRTPILNAQKIKFSIKNFFTKCDRFHKIR